MTDILRLIGRILFIIVIALLILLTGFLGWSYPLPTLGMVVGVYAAVKVANELIKRFLL